MSTDSTTIRVLVWRDVENDTKLTRHTGLMFSNNADITGTVVHAINRGDGNGFNIETMYAYNPLNSTHYAGHAAVATISRHVDAATAIAQATPVQFDPEWNCQLWIGDALKRLVDFKFITAEARDESLNEMVAILLQAGE